MALASYGSPGRIGDVHLDVIEGITPPKRYESTDAALESGAPVRLHRSRPRWSIQVRIVISDVEPIAGAGLVGLWEAQHATRTRERLEALLDSGDAVTFFDGARFRRTPAGSRVWEVAALDEVVVPDEQTLTVKTYRAVVTLAERPEYQTAFTSALANDVDASIQDQTDGITDNGQQSTEAIPAEQAGQVALG